MKKYLYVRASIYVVIAILAIIFSNFFLQNIRFTITSVMIMYGVDDLILHFFLDKNKKAKLLLLWSVIDILLGVLVMSLVSDITTIYIIWATWCLLRSIVEAIEFIFERRKEYPPYFIHLILITIEIVLSIIFLINPYDRHALIHVYYLALQLLSDVLIPAIYFVIMNIKKKKKTGETQSITNHDQ